VPDTQTACAIAGGCAKWRDIANENAIQIDGRPASTRDQRQKNKLPAWQSLADVVLGPAAAGLSVEPKIGQGPAERNACIPGGAVEGQQRAGVLPARRPHPQLDATGPCAHGGQGASAEDDAVLAEVDPRRTRQPSHLIANLTKRPQAGNREAAEDQDAQRR
jgi:hypothetical protein